MMSDDTTQYYFIPCVRRGLAAQIAEADLADGARRAQLNVELNFGNDSKYSKSIELIGPGDVYGFDPRIVARTDPLNNVGDFEPNYFCAIELTEPDFPWRMTPKRANGDGILQPWITLIVLLAEPLPDQPDSVEEFEEGITFEGNDNSRIPIPTIKVKKKNSLPDLNYAWRWAHVQVTDKVGIQSNLDHELRQIYETEPERLVSRLICARRLRSGRKYHAFIVPTFKLSVDRALGNESQSNADANTLAWEGDGDEEVTLPYYYKWEFRTGQRGDFEHLVRLLEPRVLPELGLRTVDCNNPGFNLPDAGNLGFESVFMSPTTAFTHWGLDDMREPNAATEFRNGLKTRLNNSAEFYESEQDPDEDPVVVAPVYGRWHHARSALTSEKNGSDWWDELNLDPRHRFAAGVGAEFVRKNQEQLMAAAWDQLGDIQEANEIIRRAQLARETGKRLERRLSKMSLPNYLRTTSALHQRVLYKKENVPAPTITKLLRDSRIRHAPLDPAVRRIARKRGALRKRQGASLHDDMIVRLNERGLTIASRAAPSRGMPNLAKLSAQLNAQSIGSIPDPPRTENADLSSYEVIVPENMDVTITGLPEGIVREKVSGKLKFSGQPDPPRTLIEKYNIKITLSSNNSVPENQKCSIAKEFTLTVRKRLNYPAGERSINWQVTDISSSEVALPGKELKELKELNIGSALRGIPDTHPEYPMSDIVKEMLRNNAWLSVRGEDEGGPELVDLEDVRSQLAGYITSDRTLSTRLRDRIARPFKDSVGTNAKDQSTREAEFNTIMAAPEFSQPLFGYISELSQELVLGGIEKVPQNTIARLKTNRRFLEAVLSGANHEMARELLWREYPTDQRGSYFRMFFNSTDYDPSDDDSEKLLECFKKKIQYQNWSDEDKRRYLELYQQKYEDSQELDDILLWQAEEEAMKDVAPLHTWTANRLGCNSNTFCPAVEHGDNLVILIRGDVLKKYPNTVIYAVQRIDDKPALPEFIDTKGEVRYPIFTARLKPDIAMVAFDIEDTPAEYGKWYFVLEERVSEARFGMDIEKADNDDISWEHFDMQDAFGMYVTDMDKYSPWGTDPSASTVAKYTMQKPMRLIVSGKRLLSGLG